MTTWKLWPSGYARFGIKKGSEPLLFTVALETTVSMGIMMAMGYLIRKKGWVNSEYTRQFSTMLYYSIIPCIIISSTINMEFDPQQLRKGAVMLGMGLLLIAVMAVFGQGLYRFVGKGEQGRLMRFSMVYTNRATKSKNRKSIRNKN